MKFSDIVIDETLTSETYMIRKKEIIDFASQFDPQYMHINEEKAGKSIFGGIIASGMHTMSLTFKLWTQTFVLGDDVIAGKQIRYLDLINPVYPDDELYITTKVIEKRERRNYGEIIVLVTTYKNNRVKVLKFESVVLVAK